VAEDRRPETVLDQSRKSAKEAKKSGDAIQRHAPSEPVAVSEAEAVQTEGAEGPAPVDPLEKAQKEAAENLDRWMRAAAELENYKKRTLQERSRLLKYRNEDLLRDLLSVKDNLDRALAYCNRVERSDSVAEGVCMISNMFEDILTRYGVKPIEALGKPFNPEFHEALAKQPVAGKAPNLVIEQLEKGYLYQDRLLRPAKVVVSAPPAPESAS